MADDISKIRSVQFLEPSLCLPCRFATIAALEMTNGKLRRVMQCKRLDCDNWKNDETSETPRTLKSDLAILPVEHKSQSAIKIVKDDAEYT